MRNRRLSTCERSVPRFSKKSLTAGIAFGRRGQKNAAYPTFERWFEFTFHSMVIDLGDDRIRHEEV